MYYCLKSFVVSEAKCQHQLKYDAKGKKIASDSEMQMARHDTVLVVITGGFTAMFKYRGSEVLKNSGPSNLQYITKKSTYLPKYRHS